MKLKDFDDLIKERFTSEEISQINIEAEKEVPFKNRPTFQEFKIECLKDAKIKEEYEGLCSEPQQVIPKHRRRVNNGMEKR